MGSTKLPILLRELAALLATGCDLEPRGADRKYSVSYCSFLEEIRTALMPGCGCLWVLMVSGLRIREHRFLGSGAGSM